MARSDEDALDPLTPLSRCPQLPTTQSLSAAHAGMLDRLVIRLRMQGRPATRQDVIGLLILFECPEDAASILSLLRSAPSRRSEVDGAAARLMMRLPSPVSLRLNAIIDVVQREGPRVTRRDIVSALIRRHYRMAPSGLTSRFDAYTTAVAAHAVTSTAPPEAVLSRDRPRPGRRPMPR